MWGRISSMAQAVQEKLEESLGENPEDDIEATAESSPARKVRNHSLDKMLLFTDCWFLMCFND